MGRRRRLALHDVYERVPSLACRGLCVESCGPIAMSNAEDARLRELGVTIPSMVATAAAMANGEEYFCPALVDGRCSVYEDRPTICRLWGATESMPCPHGCRPDVPLTQEESHELLRLAARAGGGMAERFFAPASEPPGDGEGDVGAPQ